MSASYLILGLFAGVLLSGIVFWFTYRTLRRQCVRLDEEKQLLQNEKEIVLEFMHDMVETIGEGIDREELFRRVSHAAILSTGAMCACVFEKTPDLRFRSVAVEGLFPPLRPFSQADGARLTTRAKFIDQVLRAEVFTEGEGLIGAVAAKGNGLLIANAALDSRVVRHEDPSLVIRSIIYVPIRFRKTTLGVLVAANPADGQAFTETDFSLAQSLAEQAGLAIHNLDLMALQIEKNKLDTDLTIASTIQAMLLPRSFPQIDGLEIDTRYCPAQKVGGDLFDLIQLPQQRLGVAIADVAGKGIPASLLMAICQSNLRHLALHEDRPAQLLIQLNRILSECMRPEIFITIIYAIVDPAANTVTLARAGHELPVFLSHEPGTQTSKTWQPASSGIALGMVPDGLFAECIEELRIPFRSGDTMVLFTDGLTETTNADGVQFSGARLMQTLKHLHRERPAALNQVLINDLDAFRGPCDLSDDLTVVTIRYA